MRGQEVEDGRVDFGILATETRLMSWWRGNKTFNAGLEVRLLTIIEVSNWVG